MSAVITHDFRRLAASKVYEDVNDAIATYYIGIGKSDPWSASEDLSTYSPPVPSPIDAHDARLNMQSLVKVSPGDVRFLIPRINFKSGYAYKSYNPFDEDLFYPSQTGVTTIFPCYAINDNKVFVCLRAGAGVALNAPTEASYSPTTSVDGYVWVRVATLEVDSPFNTDQFVAIVPNSGVTLGDTSSTAGMVYGFAVLSPGSGYSSGTKPTVKLVGKGKADVTLDISINGSGQVTKVDFTSGTIASLAFPTGYTECSVDYSGSYPGSGAVVVPIVAPSVGFGYVPRTTLPSWFLGIPSVISGEQNQDAFIIPYRQISLLRNVERNDPETPAETVGIEEDSIDGLKYFVIPENSTVNFAPGAIITQVGGSGVLAKAFFDTFKRVEVSTGVFEGRLYYHQNSSPSVNLKNFPTSGNISVSSGVTSSSYAFSAKRDAEFVTSSGELVFIENRKPITRNLQQSEELKLVVQF